MHGEVQTTTGMFRKKKEYLVLTEQSMTRYKSQAKASEFYSSIPNPIGRSPAGRHMQGLLSARPAICRRYLMLLVIKMDVCRYGRW